MATALTSPNAFDLAPVIAELRARRHARESIDVATMTLVLFFEDATLGDGARERVHRLTAKHPARVVVLDASHAAKRPHALTACAAHDACPAARGEWIELGVKGLDADVLRSSVAALALAEAPIVLLWVAAGAGDDARLSALLPLARTTVFGSSALAADASQLREVLAVARAHPEAPICDVAYLRLHPWQEAIAQFFDRKDAVDELFALRHVEIACSTEPEAYYLLGWLASRLEWTPCSEREFCNRFGTTIAFAIARKKGAHPIGHVELRSAATTFRATAADGDAPTIALAVSGALRHPARMRPIVDTGIAALVERAIVTLQHDRVFVDSLAMAGAILESRKG